MSLSSSFKTTVVNGNPRSGTKYVRRTILPENAHCWMDIAVYPSRALQNDHPSLKEPQQLLDIMEARDGFRLSEAFLKQQQDSGVATTASSDTAAVVGEREGMESIHQASSDNNNNDSATTTTTSFPCINGAYPEIVFRVAFELFRGESPMACENFMSLCQGANADRLHLKYEGHPVALSYKGTFFHKVIPGLFAQGGDITRRLDGGSNSFSAFGKQFSDENMKRSHDEVGLLAMANNGPNTNGSQFFITTTKEHAKALDGRHTCFGRVVRGLDEFLQYIAPHGDLSGRPKCFAIVTDCGKANE